MLAKDDILLAIDGQKVQGSSKHQEKVLCFNMHVTDANMHVPAPSMHVTEIAHVNMMANFSMHVQNSNMAVGNQGTSESRKLCGDLEVLRWRKQKHEKWKRLC